MSFFQSFGKIRLFVDIIMPAGVVEPTKPAGDPKSSK